MLEKISIKNERNLPDWVIIGGESGHQARPFDLMWGKELLAECEELKIPAFFKQVGSHPIFMNSRLDLQNKKGSELTELPDFLHVRNFPDITC